MLRMAPVMRKISPRGMRMSSPMILLLASQLLAKSCFSSGEDEVEDDEYGENCDGEG
jgi:hypothetical protein